MGFLMYVFLKASGWSPVVLRSSINGRIQLSRLAIKFVFGVICQP